MKSILAALVLISSVALASDEIIETINLQVANGAYSFIRTVPQLRVNQSAQGASQGIQPVTTATNLLPMTASVVTGGVSMFRNLGTNTVFVNVAIMLKSNDVALLRVASTNIPCWTTNGTANLDYLILAE